MCSDHRQHRKAGKAVTRYTELEFVKTDEIPNQDGWVFFLKKSEIRLNLLGFNTSNIV